FLIQLSADLVKSNKATLLCGWGGTLFEFPLSADQEKSFPLKPDTKSVQPFSVVDDFVLPGPADVKLSALEFTQGTSLDPAKKITGSVTVEGLAAGKGPYTLRLLLMNRNAAFTYPVPGAVPNKLDFTFRSLNESVVEHTGPLAVVMDLVTTDPKRPEIAVP